MYIVQYILEITEVVTDKTMIDFCVRAYTFGITIKNVVFVL